MTVSLWKNAGRLAAGIMLAGTLAAPVWSAGAEDDLEYVDVDSLLKEDSSQEAPKPQPKTEAEQLEDFVNIDELLYDQADRAETKKLNAAEKAAAGGAASRQSMEAELQALRKKVIDVNRDLSGMEKDMLYPVSTQVNVFVSLDAGELFKPDAIAIVVNEKVVASHLYTERELKALRRGGIQRIFTGNVKKGGHEMVAVLTGTGLKGKEYRRAVSLVFDKDAAAKYIELKIRGDKEKQEPTFTLKEWE